MKRNMLVTVGIMTMLFSVICFSGCGKNSGATEAAGVINEGATKVTEVAESVKVPEVTEVPEVPEVTRATGVPEVTEETESKVTKVTEAALQEEDNASPVPDDSEFTEVYVDVDIANQTMSLYGDFGNTLILTSPCVTGNYGSKDTPTGMHHIIDMAKNARLTGPTWDCTVNRWMKFTADGCGLHDATWRDPSEFGGTTYMGNGSHGCVNLPLDVANTIYDYLSVGDVVYVH